MMHCRCAFNLALNQLKLLPRLSAQTPNLTNVHLRTYARFQNVRSSRLPNDSEIPIEWQQNIPADKPELQQYSAVDTIPKPSREPKGEINPIFTPALPEDYEDTARQLEPSFNLAAYVNNSETLQQFVKLGVDLSKIEKNRKLAAYVLRLNFEQDVQPYIQFLHDNGVAADDIGNVLTKNVALCQESFDDLEVRINYLQSKKFTPENIGAILTRNPLWLSTPVAGIDARLGWLQQTFKLSGDEVRLVVNTLPQIVTYNLQNIKLSLFSLEEEMGFHKGMIKKLIKTKPRIFTKSQNKLLRAFEYVHNTMKVPLNQICAQPDILMEREHIIRERHLFLASLGRAQYNPRLPGYVSLDAFVKSDDQTFCTELAKAPLVAYHMFLKTL